VPAAYAAESELVRAVIQEDAAEHSSVTNASLESFASVHTRLMEAIDADVSSRAAKAQQQSTFFLPVATFLHSCTRSYSSATSYGLVACLLIVVGVGGHHFGKQHTAQALPIESIVQDFDENLHSPAPLDFLSQDGGDEKPAARWLSTQVGHPVALPAPSRTGTRLVGVRHHTLAGHAVAQAHYLKNGVRVALYEIRDPKAGVSGLETTHVHGHTFLASQRGAYHVVVWRKGDDIMTMVSPLSREPSLRLAAALRDAAPDV
jgi:hypothetical protein